MKMLKIAAITVLLAMGMQVNTFAASAILKIPTVMTIEEYAQDRTVDEVLKTVVDSAKEQLGDDGHFDFDKPQGSENEVVEEKKAESDVPQLAIGGVNGSGIVLSKNSLFTQKF